MAVLEVKNLKKIYRPRFGGNQVQALSCVNFSVEEGEYVAIMGESGSGKTTLLNIMAALDRPTEGTVCLDGKPLSDIKDKERSVWTGNRFRILRIRTSRNSAAIIWALCSRSLIFWIHLM